MVLLSIIVLVFVNYSHSKNAEILPLQFSLNVVKTPQYVCNKHCKWQTHLPYLHLETSREHNSLSNNYKNSNNSQPARGRHLG